MFRSFNSLEMSIFSNSIRKRASICFLLPTNKNVFLDCHTRNGILHIRREQKSYFGKGLVLDMMPSEDEEYEKGNNVFVCVPPPCRCRKFVKLVDLSDAKYETLKSKKGTDQLVARIQDDENELKSIPSLDGETAKWTLSLPSREKLLYNTTLVY